VSKACADVISLISFYIRVTYQRGGYVECRGSLLAPLYGALTDSSVVARYFFVWECWIRSWSFGGQQIGNGCFPIRAEL
jgi:hypothetical protein